MKEDSFEEPWNALKGLHWQNQTDVLDRLFDAIQAKEQRESLRWMAATSLIVLLFSGILFMAGKEAQEEIEQNQIDAVAKAYAVNNVNY